jgi:hypothetical protein
VDDVFARRSPGLGSRYFDDPRAFDHVPQMSCGGVARYGSFARSVNSNDDCTMPRSRGTGDKIDGWQGSQPCPALHSPGDEGTRCAGAERALARKDAVVACRLGADQKHSVLFHDVVLSRRQLEIQDGCSLANSVTHDRLGANSATHDRVPAASDRICLRPCVSDRIWREREAARTPSASPAGSEGCRSRRVLCRSGTA